MQIILPTPPNSTRDARELERQLARAVAVLKRVEWAGMYDEYRSCPYCSSYVGHPHNPHCELATLLREEG